MRTSLPVAIYKVAISPSRLFNAGLNRALALNQELRASGMQSNVVGTRMGLLNRTEKSLKQMDRMIPMAVRKDIKQGGDRYQGVVDSLDSHFRFLRNQIANEVPSVKVASADEKPPKNALTKGTYGAAVGAGFIGSQLLGAEIMHERTS